MLTKGLDNIQGTSGNDTIIGSISKDAELNTFSALDNIDGGAGKDTLKVSSEGFLAGSPATGKIVVGANVKNVEIVEASSAGVMDVDTSAAAGVETLEVVAAVGAIDAKAAATTDIAVNVNGKSSDAINTVGGKNVSVSVADAGATGDSVTVGKAGVADAAKGDVTVSVTGKAYDATAGQVTLGQLNVNGGKTISVTQKATSDASAAAAATVANIAKEVKQGDIIVTADPATTTVTVKQDANATATNAKFTTGGVTETSSVKFGALKATDAVTVNGLTLTAKVDLTAEQVAQAFANLANSAASQVAGKDTQGAALATNGTYTVAFAATGADGWTSSAANGDTVVFTAVKTNFDVTDLVITNPTKAGSVAPVQTKIQGQEHSATKAGGVMGVEAGLVTVNAGAALTTVSVDGFKTASEIKGAAAALATVNLANGTGTFAVANAAETLAVNLNKFGSAKVNATSTTDEIVAAAGTFDLNSAATKTLNVKAESSNATLALDGAANVATLNVTGSSAVTVAAGSKLTTVKVTETAGATINADAKATLTSVDTTGTTGAVSVSIDGGKATYAGGAGKDTVKVELVTGTFNKSINLGAGDDTLDLLSLTEAQLKAIPATNVLEGGEGTDTIALIAANAVALSTDAVFAGKINGFEKLSLEAAAATSVVNMSNLDNINYVVSANSSVAIAGATARTSVVTLTAGAAAGDKIILDGAEFTFAAALGAAAAAAQLTVGTVIGNWTVTNVTGTAVTVQSNTAGASVAAPVFAKTGTTIDGGAAGGAAGADATGFTINNLASGGTLELTATGSGVVVGVKDALTGAADVLNVAVNVAGDVGTVAAADVEAINVSVANKTAAGTFGAADVNGVKPVAAASDSTLTLNANAAKAVNVTGAGNLTLKLDVDNGGGTWTTVADKVATVDASTATGALTLDLFNHKGAAVTVTGGAGNDKLTASNAKADVLIGGAGSDTLTAGANGATLTGGAGNDVFKLNTAGNLSVNSFSTITDFATGDVLQLSGITSFAKLATVVQGTTEVSAFANAAVKQAVDAVTAVYFVVGNDSYVVVDKGLTPAADETFKNGEDLIIKLTGVNLDNSSFNSTSGTVELV